MHESSFERHVFASSPSDTSLVLYMYMRVKVVAPHDLSPHQRTNSDLLLPKI